MNIFSFSAAHGYGFNNMMLHNVQTSDFNTGVHSSLIISVSLTWAFHYNICENLIMQQCVRCRLSLRLTAVCKH